MPVEGEGVSSAPPNILILMTDQQRWDSLGAYGCRWAHTPNLDRLAQGGVVFDGDYVNNPICTPSRASMWTGKHLPGHGVHRLYDNLPADEVLFSRHLQRLGYATAMIGKLHVSSSRFEFENRHANDGFDVYEPCLEPSLGLDATYNAYSRWLAQHHPWFRERLAREGRRVLHHPAEVHFSHWAAERTIRFIEAQDGSRPWFAMMSLFDPHNPYEDYPPEAGELLDAAAVPGPLAFGRGFADRPAALLREHHSNHLGDAQRMTEADLGRMRFGYHASVAFADREFGRVLDALESRGLAGNTLVIFTSDHGDMLGDHGLLVKGAFFYDACARVPLLVRWPARLPGGRRSAALVQNHDLAATCLSAAGMSGGEIAALMPDSRSLLDVAAGNGGAAHEEVFCLYRNSGLSQEPTRTPYWDPPINATMIRDARYKLSLWHSEDRSAMEGGELYDMLEDPRELCNLWDDVGHARVRECLTGRILDWLGVHETGSSRRGGEALPAGFPRNAAAASEPGRGSRDDGGSA